MAQHDMNIANQGFPATRADLNNALQALVSNSSGTSAPSTTFANQWWYDTNNNKMYLRNEANNAWIEVFILDQTNNEWQLVTGQITAADGDGLVFKTDDGNTRVTLDDTGKVGVGAAPQVQHANVTDALNVGSSNIFQRTKDGYVGSNFYYDASDVGKSIASGYGAVYHQDVTNGRHNFNVSAASAGSAGGTHALRTELTIDNDGIKFQGDTAAANAISDYEEGTFNVTFSGATVSVGSDVANYTKIGNMVYWRYYTGVSTISSSSSSLILGGLPYTVFNVHGNYSGVNVGINTFFGSSVTDGQKAYHQINTDYIYFVNPATISSPSAVNGSSKYLMVGGFYQAA